MTRIVLVSDSDESKARKFGSITHNRVVRQRPQDVQMPAVTGPELVYLSLVGSLMKLDRLPPPIPYIVSWGCSLAVSSDRTRRNSIGLLNHNRQIIFNMDKLYHRPNPVQTIECWTFYLSHLTRQFDFRLEPCVN